MTLPFAEKDDGTRKWQCFVCGRFYKTFTEFKEHIKDSHEEGREYVVCPLARCEAPVRDLKSHWRAKHPTEKSTPPGPSRAIIWMDHAPKGKKGMKARKPGFRSGSLISTKMGGLEMKYKSGFECEFYECLEADDDVVAYSVEPFSVEYFFDGKQHRYFPDLSIKFTDGRIQLWEIKPASQTDLPKNKAKWDSCHAYCLSRGWEFIVVTEKGLNMLKKKIKQQKMTQNIDLLD